MCVESVQVKGEEDTTGIGKDLRESVSVSGDGVYVLFVYIHPIRLVCLQCFHPVGFFVAYGVSVGVR